MPRRPHFLKYNIESIKIEASLDNLIVISLKCFLSGRVLHQNFLLCYEQRQAVATLMNIKCILTYFQ